MSGGFLDRWSRRKAGEAAEEGAQPPSPVPAPSTETPESEAVEPAPASEMLSEEELAALPRIEDLTPESSLAPFLRAGVPASLKNAAMRRMWLLTPAIRDHKDCAVDYHWDWNTPGGVPGSGGRLEPGAVKKMLKELTDPRPAVPQPKDAANPDAAAETHAETGGDARPAPLTDAPPPRPAPVASPATSAATGTTADTATPDAPPRRRHGGARPA